MDIVGMAIDRPSTPTPTSAADDQRNFLRCVTDERITPSQRRSLHRTATTFASPVSGVDANQCTASFRDSGLDTPIA
jgi:hypothetical protein